MQKVLLRISDKHKLDFYGQSVTFVIHSQERKKTVRYISLLTLCRP